MRRHRTESKEFSEINITPFTDVVLVLLIIFMIASPVIISGAMDIKLPKASSTGKEMNKKISVSLNIEKEIMLDNKKVTEDELINSVKSQISNNSDTQVILNADYRLTHGWVVHILDLIKSSGATRILIGTGNEDNL